MQHAPEFPASLRARYEPISSLGEGGMGMVFRARDVEVDREVALKLLFLGDREEARLRFRREAEALARLEHPGILRVYDFGEADGSLFMVTELLEGHSLDRIRNPGDPLELMLSVADALDVVHRAGLVHRDIKPANLFRTQDGRLVLLDFGLALDPEVTRLTVQNAVVGTVAFMAPEVLALQEAGPAADWYSWGVSLYWLCERKVPFEFEQVMEAAGGGVLPELGFERLDPASPAACMIRACLDPDPTRRPSDRAALTEIAERSVEPRPTPRQVHLLGPLAAATCILLGAWWFRSPPEAPPPPSLPAPLEESVFEKAITRLESELDGAGDLYVRKGEKRTFRAGDPPKGWWPVLSREPVRWLHLLRLLPELDGALKWVRNGGRREELPRDVLARLRKVDDRYFRLGQPRPFAHFLDGDRDLRYQPETWELERWPDLEKLGVIEGDLAMALHAAREIIRWNGELIEAVRKLRDTGETSPLLDPEVFPRVTIVGSFNVQESLQAAVLSQERRSAAFLWARPAGARLRRFLFRGFRAVGASRRPNLVAKILMGIMEGLDDFFYTEVSLFPPNRIIGKGTTKGLGGPALEASYIRLMTRCRRLLDLPWEHLTRHQTKRLKARLARKYGGPEYPWIRRRAVRELIRAHLHLGEATTALEVFRDHLDLAAFPEGRNHLDNSVKILLPSWLKYRNAPQTLEVLPRVFDWVARMEASGEPPKRRSFHDDVKELRAAFSQLSAAAPAPPGR